MKARRLHILLAAAVLLLGVASSCGVSRIRDISLSSFGIKYIVPTSARSMEGVLLLEIDNPALSFTASDIEGLVRLEEKALLHFTAGPLPLEGKTVQVYELPCTVTLDEGASLLELVRIASRRSLEGLEADVNVHVATKNGTLKAPISFKDIDLSQFSL